MGDKSTLSVSKCNLVFTHEQEAVEGEVSDARVFRWLSLPPLGRAMPQAARESPSLTLTRTIAAVNMSPPRPSLVDSAPGGQVAGLALAPPFTVTTPPTRCKHAPWLLSMPSP